ncbi:hypothetical protein ACLOJK_015259 [Asimina triloba]
MLRQDLYTTQLKQECLKEDAAGFLSDLAAASEDEAIRVCDIDPDVNGVESCIKLETIKGEVSLLHEQVALLGSREAKLLSKCEAAQAEVVEASQVILYKKPVPPGV